MSRRERRRSRRGRAQGLAAFWRRGSLRTRRHRPSPPPKLRPGFHVPAWVPVAVITGAVAAIFLGLVLFREAGGVSPRIGDHWHARYEVWLCGVKQPVIPNFPGGVHTHGDGFVHIHPESAAEEGRGARLIKFFEYAGQALGRGGILAPDAFQMPGSDKLYRNGDVCQEGPYAGQPGEVQVRVNGRLLSAAELEDYIPQDGDEILIFFGPPGALPATPTPSPSPQGTPTPSG